MATVVTQDFLKQEYYPKCFPESVQYNLSWGGAILYRKELSDMVGGWCLNEAVSLVAEALHDYPVEQRNFLECVLGGVAQDRSYFAPMRDRMILFLKGIRHEMAVDVRGSRLTRSNLLGYEFLDERYAHEALGWRRRGEIVCFLTYPALVYLPRVLDVYRDSERQVLMAFPSASVVGLGRYYSVIPANWSSKTALSVRALNRKEYHDLGEKLMRIGASFAPVPE